MRRHFRRCLSILLVFVLTSPVLAQDGSVRVRVGAHPDFTRLVFDFTETTDFRMTPVDGGGVEVEFAYGGAADLARVDADAIARLGSIRQSRDGDRLIVTLTPANGVGVVPLAVDTMRVFDLTDGASTVAAGDLPARTRTADEQTQQADANTYGSGQTPNADTYGDAGDPSLVALPGTDPGEVAAFESALRSYLSPTPATEPRLPPQQTASVGGDPAATADPASQPDPRTPAADPSGERQPAGRPQLVTLGGLPVSPDRVAPQSPEPQRLVPDEVVDETIVRLDAGGVVPAAVFQRGRAVWVALATPELRRPPTISGLNRLLVRQYEAIRLPGFSIMRFPIPEGDEVQLRRDGPLLTLTLGQLRSTVEARSLRESEAEPSLRIGGPFATMLTITDPVVGDRILILLAPEAGLGIPRELRRPGLTLLPSSMGAAVVMGTDDASVRLSGGDAIIRSEGLTLSTARTRTADSLDNEPGDRRTDTSLFDWTRALQRTRTHGYHGAEVSMRRDILARRPENRAPLYLDLARLYLAHGLGPEAWGAVERGVEADPAYALLPEVRALRGVAALLSNHPNTAREDLDHPDMADYPEMALWRALAAMEAGDAAAAQAVMPNLDDLPRMPRPLLDRVDPRIAELAVTLADHAGLTASTERMAAANPRRRPSAGLIAYYQGEAHSMAGETPLAVASWRDAAAGRDWYARARSLMRLISLGTDAETLPAEDAIDALERLRYGWRGDDEEVEILARLGGLYLQEQRWRDGFDTLASAIGNFPESPQAPQLVEQLEQGFVTLFNNPAASESITPIEAYALFRDFESLLTEGPAGDRIIAGLADRLIEVDLLDEAAALLEQQVEFRLSGDARARTAARAAGVRLLNRQPEEALAVLDLASIPAPSPALQEEHDMLRAQALARMDRDDEALAILAARNSPAAANLRAQIHWDNEAWAEAADTLLPAMPLPLIDAELTAEEQATVLNRAVALSLADDREALFDLRETYGTAMQSAPQSYAFNVLTRPEQTDLARDLPQIRAQLDEVGMFTDFLQQYRASAPDNADPNAGETEPDVTG